jgi:hypothetical protein
MSRGGELHGDGVGVRGDVVRQDRQGCLTMRTTRVTA